MTSKNSANRFYLSATRELVYVRFWGEDDYVVVWANGGPSGVHDHYWEKIPAHLQPVWPIELEIKLGENYRHHYVEYEDRKIYLREILDSELFVHGIPIENVTKMYGFCGYVDLESKGARSCLEDFNEIKKRYDWIQTGYDESAYLMTRKNHQGTQVGYRVFFRKPEDFNLYRLAWPDSI